MTDRSTFTHWDDPRLKEIGERFKREAYTFADELNSYGADAEVYLLPEAQRGKRWMRRGSQVCIPVAFADALMALLLTLPRPEGGPGRRRRWSVTEALQLKAEGQSIREIARIISQRTGQPFGSIRRRLQELFGEN